MFLKVHVIFEQFLSKGCLSGKGARAKCGVLTRER